MHLCFIPGLGFDHRIFQNLELPDYDMTYLDWIEPQNQESIQSYAQRMDDRIPATDRIFLIGHSFGGIMAQEIAQIRTVQKIILISSLKSPTELPLHFKTLRLLKAYPLLSQNLAAKTVRYWGKGHGFESKAEQELFKSMVSKHSNHYLQWALRQLCEWNGVESQYQNPLFHIHGKKDKTLPYKFLSTPDHTIDGGHFMVYKQAPEISRLIRTQLS